MGRVLPLALAVLLLGGCLDGGFGEQEGGERGEGKEDDGPTGSVFEPPPAEPVAPLWEFPGPPQPFTSDSLKPWLVLRDAGESPCTEQPCRLAHIVLDGQGGVLATEAVGGNVTCIDLPEAEAAAAVLGLGAECPWTGFTVHLRQMRPEAWAVLRAGLDEALADNASWPAIEQGQAASLERVCQPREVPDESCEWASRDPVRFHVPDTGANLTFYPHASGIPGRYPQPVFRLLDGMRLAGSWASFPWPDAHWPSSLEPATAPTGDPFIAFTRSPGWTSYGSSWDVLVLYEDGTLLTVWAVDGAGNATLPEDPAMREAALSALDLGNVTFRHEPVSVSASARRMPAEDWELIRNQFAEGYRDRVDPEPLMRFPNLNCSDCSFLGVTAAPFTEFDWVFISFRGGTAWNHILRQFDVFRYLLYDGSH